MRGFADWLRNIIIKGNNYNRCEKKLLQKRELLFGIKVFRIIRL